MLTVINHVWEDHSFYPAEFLYNFFSVFQGSQGYGSTESDFVDMDGFQNMQTDPSTSLPELNLVGQVCVKIWKNADMILCDQENALFVFFHPAIIQIT